MSDVRIRRALRRDVPEIQAIYNHSVLHDTGSYDEEPRPIAERYYWYDDHEHSGLPVYVAESDGGVVGWSSLSRFRARPGYRYTVEDSVYVRHGFRGAGVGRLLLEAVVRDAGEVLGMHTVVAVIGDVENRASIGLHARCGFVQAALLKQVGFKFGRWLDQVWMQRLL
jgi:L-amino acid N-acyltransferase YncA